MCYSNVQSYFMPQDVSSLHLFVGIQTNAYFTIECSMLTQLINVISVIRVLIVLILYSFYSLSVIHFNLESRNESKISTISLPHLQSRNKDARYFILQRRKCSYHSMQKGETTAQRLLNRFLGQVRLKWLNYVGSTYPLFTLV